MTNTMMRGKRIRKLVKASNLFVISSLFITIIFLLLPFIFGLIVSLLTYTPGARVYEVSFTIENYLYALRYWSIIYSTIGYSLLLIAILITLAFPLAYFLSFVIKSERIQFILLFFLLTPFLIDWSIRMMAWYPVLGERGFFNYLISWIFNSLGIPWTPIKMIHTSFAVFFTWIQSYILFMTVPIYFAMLKIDPILVKAAETLRAGKLQRFYHIIFKLSLPGIVVGSIFVFVMSMADYATPAIVGGGFMTIGLVIVELVGWLLWPQALAISLVLIFIALAAVYLMLKVTDIRRLIY